MLQNTNVKFQNWKYLLFVFIWLIFICGINIYWLTLDSRPQAWDSFDHLLSSLRYYHALQDYFSKNIGSLDASKKLLSVDDHYPPLVPFIASPIYFIYGTETNIDALIAASNALFLAILILSTFYLGARLFNYHTGMLSAIAVSCYWAISYQLRMFMLDLPVTAMLCWGIYALIKTEDFESMKGSILFGLVSGLGMLTKWSYLFLYAFL